ncbi:probable WRKY transcription factor 70 [Rutidosis leptorrhynchoides]|uniref:probable WRKY transcription factor 70 n=1 Tax=Rutidosis leptorrhynchoides TaxID=125765 RepID=UPI003A99E09B
MESSSWSENLPSTRIKAIQELTQGQHLTHKLREMLVKPEKMDSVDGVVEKILDTFDSTLSIVSSTSFNINDDHIPSIRTDDVKPSSSNLDDPKSKDAGQSVKAKRGCYQRRKKSSTYTKVTSTLIDDGYAWRKYGQKVILKAKHQRNYFRCTHKIEQGCHATKQVQKTNDEPPKYKITYNGHHTCKSLQKTSQIYLDSLNPKDNSILLSFETNKITENKQVDPCSMEHTPKEGSPSLSLKHQHVSSFDHYTPLYPSTHMPSMSSCLELEDMISSGVFSSTCSNHGYEIDDMLRNDFDDLPYELCS